MGNRTSWRRTRRGRVGRAALALLLLLGASVPGASAQGLAGPVTAPAPDMAAVERELQAILDYAAPDETVSFPVPSGARASVRPDLPVDRFSGRQCIGCANPCRGYEITYRSVEGTRELVMRGFRCRQAATGLWVMREPETIVADRRLAPEEARPPLAERSGEDPRIATDRAPMPRPAPRADEGAGAGPDGAGPSGDGVDRAAAPAEGREVASAAGTPAGGASAGGGRTGADAGVRDLPAPPPDEGEREVAAVLPEAEEPARIIYPPTSTTDPVATGGERIGHDPQVVEALQRLRYLPHSEAGAPPGPEAVEEAVRAFASDERITLPLDHGLLVMRLSSAVERNEGLPACAVERPAGAGYAACLKRE